MGNSTISMVIFHSYVSHYQRVVRNVEVYHPDVPQTGDIGKFQVGCCVVGRFLGLGCGGLCVQMVMS